MLHLEPQTASNYITLYSLKLSFLQAGSEYLFYGQTVSLRNLSVQFSDTQVNINQYFPILLSWKFTVSGCTPLPISLQSTWDLWHKMLHRDLCSFQYFYFPQTPHLFTYQLRQHFSTAGPWHQSYRAARGSPGICHFSFLSIFHE